MLGRHKREFLRTYRTCYIKTHCCFCSFFTEKTIPILILFNVRLSRLHELKKIWNDWSIINFHYSEPQKAQLVDPEFKIQVTWGVKNIKTRVRTPCIGGNRVQILCIAKWVKSGQKWTKMYKNGQKWTKVGILVIHTCGNRIQILCFAKILAMAALQIPLRFLQQFYHQFLC